MDENLTPGSKRCIRCGELRPLTHFLKRTGKRYGKGVRRGTCRSCRKQVKQVEVMKGIPPREHAASAALPVRSSIRRTPLPAPPSYPEGQPDASLLRPNRQGMIRMRGRTDKGSRWHQEIELDLAVTLVKEYAAVVVNRHTIRRLYSNKDFRRYILTRDHHTCFFCGGYGDTIDHLLPKAKGGHTTPLNCVCACNECNQVKADRDLDEFALHRESLSEQ